TPLHVVVGADADGADPLLLADDMLQRRDELLGEASMGDENHSDHRSSFRPAGQGPLPVPARSSSRCARLTRYPCPASHSASRADTTTDRCLPPVQPTAMVR